MPERLKAILDKITAWWKKFNTKQRSVLISIVAVVIVALVILGVVDFHTIRIYPRTFSLPRSGSLSRRKILSMFRLITSYSLTCFFCFP